MKLLSKISKIASALLCAPFLLCLFSPMASADDEVVYLGDRKDLMIPRDYEDSIGWNTAHSGEKITTWELSFDKGIGFHCREKGLAYIEFDISSLGMNYFSATVGILKKASYYLDEGSISFRVYGDGALLCKTPVIKWNKKPAYICVPVTGVKTLRLEEDNAGSWVCDAGVWGDAALYKSEPTPPEWFTRFDPNNTDKKQEESVVAGDYAYVSDLYFKAYTGEAECRDRNTAGEMIVTSDGTYFPKGIGFHASEGGYNTYIDVDISGLGYTKFASYYGVSETLTGLDITMANIRFAVFGDGTKLFESGAVKWGAPMAYTECDITGVKTLRLAIKGNPRIDGAWGTWGGALLSKSGVVNDGMFFTDYYSAIAVTPTPTETPVTPTPTETPVTPTPTETPVTPTPTETPVTPTPTETPVTPTPTETPVTPTPTETPVTPTPTETPVTPTPTETPVTPAPTETPVTTTPIETPTPEPTNTDNASPSSGEHPGQEEQPDKETNGGLIAALIAGAAALLCAGVAAALIIKRRKNRK